MKLNWFFMNYANIIQTSEEKPCFAMFWKDENDTKVFKNMNACEL